VNYILQYYIVGNGEMHHERYENLRNMEVRIISIKREFGTKARISCYKRIEGVDYES